MVTEGPGWAHGSTTVWSGLSHEVTVYDVTGSVELLSPGRQVTTAWSSMAYSVSTPEGGLGGKASPGFHAKTAEALVSIPAVSSTTVGTSCGPLIRWLPFSMTPPFPVG